MGKLIRISPKKRPPKKLLIVGGAFVVLVGVAGVLLVTRPWEQQPTSADNGDTAELAPLNAVERADIMAGEGDYQGSQALLDSELLAQASTTDEKQQVYIQKAVLAMNNKNYDEAMTYAKEAETIRSDKMSVRLIGQIAEQRGDKSLAVDYYTKVLSLYTDEERNSDVGALQHQSDQSALERVSQ